MASTKLTFLNVTYGFAQGPPLFENLSCSLSNLGDAGKIIALMGPSGVGKTTFCDLALGLHRPKTGSIAVEPNGANIAAIPQKGVLFEELSVEENIACLRHSRTLGPTFRRERVQQAVGMLGLGDVLANRTHAGALSGGEAQRVMLARVQAIDCNLLILDEPCSFLDNRVKDHFLSALRAAVDKAHLLALLVTHVWDEARLVSDEVLFLHRAARGSVTVHHDTVANAQLAPPTLDALYGIHWPEVRIVDLADAAYDTHIPTERIPPGARFLGLHRDAPKSTPNDPWARELWDRVGRLQPHQWRLHSDLAAGAASAVTATFYGENGVRLNLARLPT